VSQDPSLVSFAVANTSATWLVLRRSPHLGLSVLADHHDRACRQLAGPAEDRFTGLGTSATPEGALLLEEAVASFDCTVHEEVLAGDHTIVLLRLHGVSDPGHNHPLVFHRSGFGRLADSA
jgi:flavin reductase (DIM6/NTAB) family NADH-FMN oxidoreductase RutF